MVKRIISGGQTGADRGGLDAAIELGIEHGGHCPKGRVAEDRRIPDKYYLTETRSRGYTQRTRLNVQNSDATLIFALEGMTPGSAFTQRCCEQFRKPYLILIVYEDPGIVRDWLASWKVETLNVAGSRESKCPGIQARVKRVLCEALRRST